MIGLVVSWCCVSSACLMSPSSLCVSAIFSRALRAVGMRMISLCLNLSEDSISNSITYFIVSNSPCRIIIIIKQSFSQYKIIVHSVLYQYQYHTTSLV